MKRIVVLLVGLALLGTTLGCSGDGAKGKNKDKDMPTNKKEG
jgi:hypothetical protein